jgi:hypothetical protein
MLGRDHVRSEEIREQLGTAGSLEEMQSYQMEWRSHVD